MSGGIHDPTVCFKCGANTWTACKHRKAHREKPKFVYELDKIENYRKASGGGRFNKLRHVR